MAENMYCSGQKGNSKEFDERFDNIEWDTKKEPKKDEAIEPKRKR